MNAVKNVRIRECFTRLRQSNKKALIGYIAAGHPKLDSTVDLMHCMVKSGTDLIEVGIPFSDPAADGPVIQRATQKALDNGITLSKILDQIHLFRKKDTQTPVILMGYLNPIEKMGWKIFAKRAAEVGVDGVLVVDLPPDEASESVLILREMKISSIFLVAPTTDEKRLSQIGPMADGFIYFVSLNGITGQGEPDFSHVDSFMPTIRNFTNLPILIGFGVRNPEMAQRAARQSDGVIIGSAIVDILEKTSSNNSMDELSKFLTSIRFAIDT